MTCLHRLPRVATLVLSLALVCSAKGEVGLPLERTSYLVGEVIPLAATTGQSLEIVNEEGTVATHGAAKGAVLKLDTSTMAPGEYRVHAEGEPTDVRLTLVHPIRDTMAANIEEMNLAYQPLVLSMQTGLLPQRDKAAAVEDLKHHLRRGFLVSPPRERKQNLLPSALPA